MLRPGWVLERYYDWSVVEQGPTLKLLRKSRGPIATFLLLTRGASEEEIADTARWHGLLGWRSIVVFRDFSSDSENGIRVIAGVQFRRVTTGRWFGVGTFVVDLSQTLDTLWRRIAPRERGKCRRAEHLGIKVEFDEHPSERALDAFLGLYGRMARKRGLERPRRRTLEEMFTRGNLLMARCFDPSGQNLVINLIYLSNGQGYYLHGARADGIAAGAGHFTQWETVRMLKTMGFRYYDLGLVSSRDASDGIYRFKGSLGGSFVDFGREFECVPVGLRAAYGVFHILRTRVRKVA